MSPEVIKLIVVASIIVAGTIGPVTAIAYIGGKGLDAIGRNPEAGSKIQTAMILAIAFAEAIAIYALVVTLVVKFV